MNLHDFEYFNALGDLLSFTAVSNHFGVSQPTITYAVKRLEQYYNCNLIYKDPSHRTVVLTDEGKILKIHIESILEELALTQRAIEHSKNHQNHIGFPPIIRAKILAQLLNDKDAISFLSKFDLVSGGSEELLAKLISGTIDFSLIGSIAPLMHPNLFVKLLYQRDVNFISLSLRIIPLPHAPKFHLKKLWITRLSCLMKALCIWKLSKI